MRGKNEVKEEMANLNLGEDCSVLMVECRRSNRRRKGEEEEEKKKGEATTTTAIVSPSALATKVFGVNEREHLKSMRSVSSPSSIQPPSIPLPSNTLINFEEKEKNSKLKGYNEHTTSHRHSHQTNISRMVAFYSTTGYFGQDLFRLFVFIRSSFDRLPILSLSPHSHTTTWPSSQVNKEVDTTVLLSKYAVICPTSKMCR